MMLEYTESFINVGGKNIHYYRTGGKKPPFILLHGAMDSGLCWTPVAEKLDEHYDVIMPDAQGHGLSDRIDPKFNLNTLAYQIVGLIRDLNIQDPIIMGHSMGAGTATNIAANYPDIPKAVLLEDPGWMSASNSTGENPSERMNQAREFMRSLIGDGSRTVEDYIAMCREMNPGWPEGDILPWAESKLRFDPKLFKIPRDKELKYTDLIPRFVCPVLLLTSDSGIVTDKVAENAVNLSKAERPLKWVKVNGAGHNIRRDQHEEFCKVIFEFLDTLKE